MHEKLHALVVLHAHNTCTCNACTYVVDSLLVNTAHKNTMLKNTVPWSYMVHGGHTWCMVVIHGAWWSYMVHGGHTWCMVVIHGAYKAHTNTHIPTRARAHTHTYYKFIQKHTSENLWAACSFICAWSYMVIYTHTFTHTHTNAPHTHTNAYKSTPP